MVNVVTIAVALTLAAASVPIAADAPVTAVTVYSDRARVTRTATVALSGRQRVELPLLIEGVDVSSIRLSAQNADIETVDIAYVEADAFRQDEARELLAALEKIDDQIAHAHRDRDIHDEMGAAGRLEPQPPPANLQRPPPKLNAGGWASIFAFARGWSEKMQAKTRALDQKVDELHRTREGLAERARILGGAVRRAGYRVTSTLTGKGAATITLSYVVGRARWRPSYDIQLRPERGQVEILFSGMVSQESGEDWTDAALTLSTAVPATSVPFPKLTSWKIAERERFIPTPRPHVEPPPRPPPSAPPLPVEPRASEDLRQALLDQVQEKEYEEEGVVSSGAGRAVGSVKSKAAGGAPMEAAAPHRPELIGGLRGPQSPPSPSMAAGVAKPSAAPTSSVEESYDTNLLDEAPTNARSIQSVPTGKRADVTSVSTPQPTATIGIAPPPGYRPPGFAPDLPAALAGGYDLAYPSAARETIRSGKGARRVALFARTWPVAVERKVFPALAPEAFLVAEIKNPSAQALPGGPANLFVGADPAGAASLKLVAPGQVFTLPLGIDRAVKPVRNIAVKQAEKGIISKDEITEYVVTTEIANPTGAPLLVRIIDQMPVTDDKDVEVKLLRVEPALHAQDPVKGEIEWRVTIPASGKATVRFVYSLRRPKGYRLHQ